MSKCRLVSHCLLLRRWCCHLLEFVNIIARLIDVIFGSREVDICKSVGVFAIAHDECQWIVNRDAVASGKASAAACYAVNPVFLTVNIFRREELESHGGKFCGGFTGTAVVDDVMDGEGWRRW